MKHAVWIIAMKSSKRKEGFTLIELMVAMMILFISMTAILDFVTKYHRINMENVMRNEAMRMVEAKLEEFRNTTYGSWDTATVTKTGRIRNIDVSYSLEPVIETISDYSTAIRVEATWTYRGITHHHNASTIIATDA
jgi:prepilin-type N-terminal cleavage/methylation domain-containing protein